MITRLPLLGSLLALSICLPALATPFQVGEAVEVFWKDSWWPATVERLQPTFRTLKCHTSICST